MDLALWETLEGRKELGAEPLGHRKKMQKPWALLRSPELLGECQEATGRGNGRSTAVGPWLCRDAGDRSALWLGCFRGTSCPLGKASLLLLSCILNSQGSVWHAR